jgi:ADP-ribosylglycohydrolase
MLRIGHAIEWTDEFAAITHIGAGWVATEAVAMAAYCAVRHRDDFVSAIRRAVNIPGDSDSVGSIAGGLVAARMGVGAIPHEWISRLEGLDRLTDLADRLAAKKVALSSQ